MYYLRVSMEQEFGFRSPQVELMCQRSLGSYLSLGVLFQGHWSVAEFCYFQ